MRTRCISFMPVMVRAIPARPTPKTNTRRLLHPQPPQQTAHLLHVGGAMYQAVDGAGAARDAEGARVKFKCPYGQAGDRLAIGEPWRTLREYDHLKPSELPADAPISYEADALTALPPEQRGRYRHARFLPRRFRRLLLEIVSIRVERLHAISEADAWAEGVRQGWWKQQPSYVLDEELMADRAAFDPLPCFQQLWEKIHGALSWAANPWVWRVEFRLVA